MTTSFLPVDNNLSLPEFHSRLRRIVLLRDYIYQQYPLIVIPKGFISQSFDMKCFFFRDNCNNKVRIPKTHFNPTKDRNIFDFYVTDSVYVAPIPPTSINIEILGGKTEMISIQSNNINYSNMMSGTSAMHGLQCNFVEDDNPELYNKIMTNLDKITQLLMEIKTEL